MTPKTASPQFRLAFLVYLVLFHAAWVGWVYLVYPRLQSLGDATLSYALANLTLRLLIWVAPVFIYLRWIDRVEALTYLKLKQHWRRGLLVALGFSALNFLLSLARYGWPHPHAGLVTWNSILGTSFLIGFIEEIPYRGFIFQKLAESFSLVTATLISALLFLLIHMPGWISLHLLRPATIIFVFIFGVVMIILFRWAKSLWAPIVSHSLNDFMSAVLFHT
jgi:membrane protease YdiL (CAAX protease family)